MGRPAMDLPDELKEQLLDIKLEEQCSWRDLVTHYEELTGGETLDWKTLRKILMRDAPTAFIPQRVSARVREAIENTWNDVDAMQLVMYALNQRFSEWSLLNQKMLRSYVDEGAERDEDVPRFSVKDRERMDQLWNDIMGFFFRAASLMKELNADDHPVFNILVNGDGPAAVGVRSTTSKDGLNEAQSIEAIVAQVGEQTQEALQGILESHRTEQRGLYRPIPDLEEDLLEDDA